MAFGFNLNSGSNPANSVPLTLILGGASLAQRFLNGRAGRPAICLPIKPQRCDEPVHSGGQT